jgi:N-acetylglucosaminyl-diphospho-decaprenol L-rhamnosyltransferase
MNQDDRHIDVAIITVSTNMLHEDCLKSVKTLMDSTPLRVEFVLVDNASTDYDANSYVKKFVPNARVILRDGNYGFGDSSNVGAKAVNAKYYFFLNPDTRVDDANLITQLHEFLTTYPKVGIAAPKILYMDGTVQQTCRRFPSWYTPIVQRTSVLQEDKIKEHQHKFLMQDFKHHKRRLVDWVQGSAFMIDGELFHKIGGFDPRYFMYYEDVDLCRTCWEHDRPVYYLPHTQLFHAYGKESAKGDGNIKKILHNKKTRVHISSWLKYTWKWLWKKTKR